MANEKNYVTEQEADLIESALRLAIGNVEGFDGAPYIKKIADELDKKGIPYNLDKTGEQIYFPWCEDDVICHYGSYGHKLGLYEICGRNLMTKEELAKDSVKGNLTLESVLSRIEGAYSKIKGAK